MIAQMAATAGSVAIGSTVGHALSSMLFGGGGGTDAQASSTQPRVEPPVQQQAHQQTGGISCEGQAKGIMATCQISSSSDLSCFPRKTSQIVLRALI
jgi:hypothetical protein